MSAKGLVAGICVVALAGALAGCSSSSMGSPTLAAMSTPDPLQQTPVPATAAIPAPAPIVFGAFLDGPVGSKLPDADRSTALQAENGAVSSGERRTWKGAKGVYGFVVPAPSSQAPATGGAAPSDGSSGECRSFTSTIYFAGRPTTGHGTGCRDADGTWRVTS